MLIRSAPRPSRDGSFATPTFVGNGLHPAWLGGLVRVQSRSLTGFEPVRVPSLGRLSILSSPSKREVKALAVERAGGATGIREPRLLNGASQGKIAATGGLPVSWPGLSVRRRMPVTQAQHSLPLLVAMSAIAIALRAVSQRTRIAYPVVLAAGGVAVGFFPGSREIVSPDLILLVFVPGLVFHASITLTLDHLRRLIAPIALLSTVGVAVSVGIIATGTHALLGLAWSDSFLLAAILAPTDPMAVVSVLRSLRAPAGLSALLEGESLFNDGTGVAVFGALLASIAAGTPSAGDVALRLAVTTAGGALVGIAWGAVGSAVLRMFTEVPLEFLASLTIAYGAYLTGDVLHVSGIVAVVTAGITLAVTAKRTRVHGGELLDFWETLGFILNAILFLLIGAALPTPDLVAVAGPIAVVSLLMLGARLCHVHALLAAVDWRVRSLPWHWRHLAVWGGLRGALSVALALSLQTQHDVSPQVAQIA